MNTGTILFAPLCLCLLAGCETRAGIRSAPSDAGVAAAYTAPFDDVRRAARDALAEAEFAVREDEAWDSRWRLIASQGLASGTLGRLARVVLGGVKPVDVHVLVRSKIDTDPATAADEAIARDIHRRIAARLQR